MGNLDIRDIAEHVDENKNQSLDPKEWKLIANLFGAQPKELKADIQNDFSRDKFMTDEQRKQIALQEQLKVDVKSENKEIKAYNEKLESLKKNLESTRLINILLGMLGERIKITNKREDIQYYKDFLTTVKNNIKDKVAPETITTDIQTMLGSLSQKEQEFLVKERLTTNQDDNLKKTEQSQETSVGNVNGLKDSLNTLESNEIIEFKGVIDNLKNRLLTPEKIPRFASMMNILRSMNGLKKDQIMSVVDTTIDTKLADKKDSPEIKGFKETLSAVLEKGLIGKFINKVDEDLNKNEKLQGTSYDILLDKKTDLKSAESRAGILNVFNADENGFNRLIEDFANSDKKAQVENIVKEYVKSGFSKEDLGNMTVAVGEVALESGEKKKCFTMKNGDNVLQLPSGKKDANGKDIMQNITPFFGDAKHGKKLSVAQYMTPDLMKDVLGKNNLKMEGVAGVIGEINAIKDKRGMNLSDFLSSLINNPMLREIWKAILEGLLTFGIGGEQTQVKLDFEKARNPVMKEWDIKKQDYPQYQNKSSLWIIDEISKYPFITKKITEDGKNVLSNNFLGGEKHFFSTVLTPSEQIDYILDDKKRKVLESQNTRNISSQTFQDKNGQVRITDEKISGGVNKPNLNPETLVEGKETEIVGHKVIKQGDYYLIDGQPIPLNGSIFVKEGNNLVEKVLKVTQDPTTKKDIITFESKDIDSKPISVMSVFKEKKLIYPENNGPISDDKLNLFKYYALEKSVDETPLHPIDALLELDPKNDDIEKAIVDMKKELITNTSNTKESLQRIFNKGKTAIDTVISGLSNPQKNIVQKALNEWSTAVGINMIPRKI